MYIGGMFNLRSSNVVIFLVGEVAFAIELYSAIKSLIASIFCCGDGVLGITFFFILRSATAAGGFIIGGFITLGTGTDTDGGVNTLLLSK